jgi:hypothetical protein
MLPALLRLAAALGAAGADKITLDVGQENHQYSQDVIRCHKFEINLGLAVMVYPLLIPIRFSGSHGDGG